MNFTTSLLYTATNPLFVAGTSGALLLGNGSEAVRLVCFYVKGRPFAFEVICEGRTVAHEGFTSSESPAAAFERIMECYGSVRDSLNARLAA